MTSAGIDAPKVNGAPESARATTGSSLGRAALLVAGLVALGSVLGLARDLVIANYFGTTAATDAFLVAWTLPETAQPLLIDSAMSLALVPLFARELAGRGDVRALMSHSFMPLVMAAAVVSGALALGAPLVVTLLAPGLAEPELAARCVRAAAASVLLFAVTGYLMAALRAQQAFGWPAAVSTAFNIGVIATIVLLQPQLGVLSAAIGLSVGAVAMLLVQTPTFLRLYGFPPLALSPSRELVAQIGLFVPVAAYTLARQAQVFVERFFGSLLSPGVITQLNYATKVAQVPMLLAVTVALVSLPSMVRQAATGQSEELRATIERNIRLACLLIVPTIVVLVLFAPQIVALLFQRGKLQQEDARAIARLLRIYSLGLVGQVIVGVTVPAFVASRRPAWYPALAAAGGLAVTAGCAAVAYTRLHAEGLALANAVGITVMGAAMLRGVARRVAPLHLSPLAAFAARCAVAGVVAIGAGVGAEAIAGQILSATRLRDATVIATGGASVVGAFLAAAVVLQIDESAALVRRIRGR